MPKSPKASVSPSMLELPDHEASVHQTEEEWEKMLKSGALSPAAQGLLEQWESALTTHTKSWADQQWADIEVDDVWADMTQHLLNQTRKWLIVYGDDGMIQRVPYGRVSSKGHPPHYFDEGIEYFARHGNAYSRYVQMHEEVEEHSTEVWPFFMRALLNVAEKRSTPDNITPLLGLARQLTTTERKRQLLTDSVVKTLHTASKNTIKDAMSLLESYTTSEALQEIWGALGKDHNEGKWIIKGLNTQKKTHDFWVEVCALPIISSEQVNAYSAALFSKNSLAEALRMYNPQVFCDAFIRLICSPHKLSVENFGKVLTKCTERIPYTFLLNTLQLSFSNNPSVGPYFKQLMQHTNPEQRHTFIERGCSEPALLAHLPQEWLQESMTHFLDQGLLDSVDQLMGATNITLGEEEWDLYWNWMSREHPNLGGALRAHMERKILHAAADDLKPTGSVKRKM